jgi:hypothetical protein
MITGWRRRRPEITTLFTWSLTFPLGICSDNRASSASVAVYGQILELLQVRSRGAFIVMR